MGSAESQLILGDPVHHCLPVAGLHVGLHTSARGEMAVQKPAHSGSSVQRPHSSTPGLLYRGRLETTCQHFVSLLQLSG